MGKLLIDIWTHYIFNFLDIKSQIRIRSACKTTQHLQITDLLNINSIYRSKLSATVLAQYPYIRYLYAGIETYIKNNDIQTLNLIKLDARNNGLINDVNNFLNLEELNARGVCGIDDKGMQLCIKIKKLDVHANNKITKISHLLELEYLNAGWNSGITNEALRICTTIKKLNVYNNNNITNVNGLPELEYLNAGWECGIDDIGLQLCKKLKKLAACYNDKITNVIHLSNLEYLAVDGSCGINDNGIPPSVQKISASCNNKITNKNNIDRFTKLVDLEDLFGTY